MNSCLNPSQLGPSVGTQAQQQSPWAGVSHWGGGPISTLPAVVGGNGTFPGVTPGDFHTLPGRVGDIGGNQQQPNYGSIGPDNWRKSREGWNWMMSQAPGGTSGLEHLEGMLGYQPQRGRTGGWDFGDSNGQGGQRFADRFGNPVGQPGAQPGVGSNNPFMPTPISGGYNLGNPRTPTIVGPANPGTMYATNPMKFL